MSDAPIQIRKPEVVRAIRELARKSGRPLTEAVADAVTEALRRHEDLKEGERDRRLALMRDAVRRFNELPVVGPLLTDEDLYDEDGMPK